MSNKKITKSGFYKLSEIHESEIVLENWVEAIFFDEWNISKKIYLSENSKLSLCWFLEKQEDYSVEIIQNGGNSQSEIRYLLLSKNDEKLKVKIHSKIESNNSSSDVKIVSFASEQGFIDLDGIIDLAANHEKMSWHLTEENIFLWSKWKIRWVPTLLVKSDDVEASHACKIHKISDEKLFYLRSRWIEKTDATLMIIESQISESLSILKDYNIDFYEEKYNLIFEKIVK